MADPSTLDISQRLIEFANAGDAKMVGLLLAQGADPRLSASQALRQAASNGHAECVRLLIPSSLPNARDSQALCWAADNGHVECVKMLIPVSNPLAGDSRAIRLAAYNGHAECLKLLIPVSDTKVRNSFPLRLAAHHGHIECIRLLIPESGPLLHNELILASTLLSGCPKTLSLMLASEPLFLSGADLPNCVADAIANGHSHLADFLSAIIDGEAISEHVSNATDTLPSHPHRL